MKKSKLAVLISGIGAALTASACVFTASQPQVIESLAPKNYTLNSYKDGKVVILENTLSSIGLKGVEYSNFSVNRSLFDINDDGIIDVIVNSNYNKPPVIDIDYKNLKADFQYRIVDFVEVLKRSQENESRFIEADSLLKRVKENFSGLKPTEKTKDYDSWSN